jgi:hypothetical protein
MVTRHTLKLCIRIMLVIAGWLVVGLGVIEVIPYAASRLLFAPVHAQFRAQMDAGRVYVDSLTEKDIPVWIERTEKLLSEHPASVSVGTKAIPPDLLKLKIIKVNVGVNVVCYAWMGGLDHTELQIHRLETGSFQFVAQYNDGRSKVIWPKE